MNDLPSKTLLDGLRAGESRAATQIHERYVLRLIGLARKLLAANEGSITARGEPGKGATFTVALPAAATASRSSRPG